MKTELFHVLWPHLGLLSHTNISIVIIISGQVGAVSIHGTYRCQIRSTQLTNIQMVSLISKSYLSPLSGIYNLFVQSSKL